MTHHVGGVGAEEIRTFARPVRAHDDEVGAERGRLLDDLVMDAALAHGDRYVARVDTLIRTQTIPKLAKGGDRSVQQHLNSMRVNDPSSLKGATVLVLDGPADFDAAGARSVSPLDVGVTPDLLARLAIACTAAELADALTPRLVRMLVRQGAPAVVAFSPETEVFAPLPDVVELVGEHGIVLAPRLDAAFPDDDLEPTPAQLAAVVYGGAPLESIGIEGDMALAKRFVTLFPLPPKVAAH